MKNLLITVLMFTFISSAFAEDDFSLPKLKLKEEISNTGINDENFRNESPVQIRKRKALSTYFGAGYTFIIFTDEQLNTAYPLLDISKGEFLTMINLFFGFSIASALTLEFEPSIIMSTNNRLLHFQMDPPRQIGTSTYSYAHPQEMSILSFPLAVNVRYFPMAAQTSWFRLFFIGAGSGAIFIREEYTNIYNNDPQSININYGNITYGTESTSQWQPIFRAMTGFTGTGGQFGFGGELRYNYIPLTQTNEPFATRRASNFNSFDISLRFYFSL